MGWFLYDRDLCHERIQDLLVNVNIEKFMPVSKLKETRD